MAKVNKQGKPLPAVFMHGKCVLVRRRDGVDVCAPDTGTWATFKTERHAKWSATLYTNLSEKFGRYLPDADEAYVAHMTRAYPHLGE
jgi:hypothetical protein